MLTRTAARRRRLSSPRRPARAIVAAFTVALLVGTALLMLPACVVDAPPDDLLPAPTTAVGGAPFMTALFTSASSLFVTGLVVVDTATYWTPLGHGVILGLIELGGLGVMTTASLLAILLARRLGLRRRMVVSAEAGLTMIDVRRTLVRIAAVAFGIQAAAGVVVAGRLLVGYDYPLGRAVWHGLFHAGSAFNNAGFALYSDSVMGFVTDPWITLALAGAIILGGLGFPVLLELGHNHRRPGRWTMSTKLVLIGTGAMLALGTAALTMIEWNNPDTLGDLSAPQKLLAGFFASTTTRTAGFNNLDISAMQTQSWFVQDLLMFVGTGPAGTGGGLKITTFGVLFFIILTELRGDGAVNILGKRLARSVHREAITVALLAVAVVVTATFVMLMTTTFTLDQLLFEVISAFATVGLSTGITHLLPAGDQLLLVLVMFIGRIGPLTLGSALALRRRTIAYELPKERPLIG